MIRYTLITILLCTGILAFAGNPVVDSLIGVLEKSKIDTQRVDIYNSLCWELTYSDTEKALEYGKMGLELAEKIGYEQGKAGSLNNIGVVYKNTGEYDKAVEAYNMAMELQEKLGNKEGMSSLYLNLGVIAQYRGDYKESIEYFEKSEGIDRETNNLSATGTCLYNAGISYYYLSDLTSALEKFLEALKIFEEYGNKKGMAYALNVLGVIYKDQGDLDNALKSYKESLAINEENGDLAGMGGCYSNIALIYKELKQTDESIRYTKLGLDIREKLGDKKGIAISLTNLANTYHEMGDDKKSIEYNIKTLDIQREIGDKEGIATTLNNMAESYRSLNQHKKALVLLEEAAALAKEIGRRYVEARAYGNTSDSYAKLGDYKSAYDFFRKYSEIKDSIYTQESQEQMTEMQTKYETEKKEKEIELLNKDKKLKELEIQNQEMEIRTKNEENARQKLIIYSFIIGFILIVIFAVWLFKLYKDKKRANHLLILKNEEITAQKEEIEAQRDEIEAQRDEITRHRDLVVLQKEEIEDSIKYAKRIQNAVLPGLGKLFANEGKFAGMDYFILFKPKDVVSGDFYWATAVGDWLILTVADCTGHGVPGAFMSMLGVSFLNEIVRKKEVTKASQVLDELRVSVIESLSQKAGVENIGTSIKDGMDISLCAINSITMECQWSGANNPLYLVRKGTLDIENEKLQLFDNNDAENNLYEVKGDKMPISIHERMDAFTNNIIPLKKGDRLYLSSDGFPDQFGGPLGKKYKYKAFKHLLLNTADLPLNEQKSMLESELDSWMNYRKTISQTDSWAGVEMYEQVDDITVFGIQI